MRIVVCINRIPDPEAPWKEVELNESSTAPRLDRLDLMMGPFDENALEVALQLKDSAEAHVTALSLSPESNEDVLKRALGIRCDAAVHVREDRAVDLDSAGTSHLLATAIRRLGEVDLVLCGRQVGDWDGGQVGQLLAEALRLPCVTLVQKIESTGGRIFRMAKEISGGIALLEARFPAVATITNTSFNQLRVAKVKDVLAARRMPITTWTADDLGVSTTALLAGSRRVGVRRVYLPEGQAQARRIDATDVDAAAEEIAQYIVGLKLPAGAARVEEEG